MTITEKCAYLKGLAEGMKLDADKPEVKLINAIIDLLDEVTVAIDEIDDDLETLNDYIEEVDEDLGMVEELLYDDDDCDCCDCEDDDCDCCDCCDDEDMICAMCPACGEQICFDDSVDPSDIECPACGAALCEEVEE